MIVHEKVAAYAAQYPFELDPFQVEALEALSRESSVLVAAPTGAGKTVIGEFAVWLAMAEGGKAFYTTPLKALSNQKFGDFVALHGAASTGLLTGDNSINPRARVVVMTTEVLRNMIYDRSELLEDLRYVVLDEVHYLQDPYRGAVWEEVLIHLPVDVKVVCLSATVSNAEDFAQWIQTLRGPAVAIIEEKRPIRLEHHYLVEDELMSMFTTVDGEVRPNPAVERVEERRRKAERARRVSQHPRDRRRRAPPRRADVVEVLAAEAMLPAIYFIFSRKGCDAAVSRCMKEGIRLTTPPERRRIREFAEMRCSYLTDSDLSVLGYSEWVEALAAGIASHHAGRIPVFKETVEELFQAGLVKVVFATETLSLGINMPARSVVIESLNKFTGERHEVITPGQFTQLTGRAGRRGMDTLGHAVVLEQPDIPFAQIAALASTRTYPLASSFQHSYNMATNLVRNYSRPEAEHLLNSSFGQFLADRDVVVLEQLIERNEAYLSSYREKLACDLGDFPQYWKMSEHLARLERSMDQNLQEARRQKVRSILEGTKPGQILLITSGRRKGPVVVVSAARTRRGQPQVIALTRQRHTLRLSPGDFTEPPRMIGTLAAALPARTAGRVSIPLEAKKKISAALETLEVPEEGWDEEMPPEDEEHRWRTEVASLKASLLSHPCHACPDRDRHAQWAERAHRLEREVATLRKRSQSHTRTLSRAFDRVLDLLSQYGYVEAFELTPKGTVLAHIYNENDLLVAETLSRGWFSGLDPAELAAVVSAFVFESRGPVRLVGRMPTQATRQTYAKIVRLCDRIRHEEQRAGLELTRFTESGFADVIYRWCRGAELEDVLDEDVTAGDFIRSSRQTLDLLRQLREAADGPLGSVLGSAIEGVNRGVLAYTGVI